MTASTLAQSDDGDVLTAANPVATPITIAAAGRFVQCEWSANEEAQIDVDLASGLGDQIEQALAESVDQAVLANIVSGTQSMSQAAVDAALWRQAIARLMANTNGAFGPGESAAAKQLRGIFHTSQYPHLMGIEEFTHADVRGDSENPQVKGIFTKGGGVNVRFSTVITQDANGYHNAVYVSSAFVIGWNQRAKVFNEQTELLFRINVFCNFGSNVKHDLRFVPIRTAA
jgi:hypothetical protein